MENFVVLVCIPGDTMAEWMKNTAPEEQKKQSDQMMTDWQKWMEKNKASLVDGGRPVGKTKRVMKGSVTDARNDLNWVMVVKAESQDVAVAMFKDHPHLEISGSYIDVCTSKQSMM